jgi:hypothetical protein
MKVTLGQFARALYIPLHSAAPLDAFIFIHRLTLLSDGRIDVLTEDFISVGHQLTSTFTFWPDGRHVQYIKQMYR